MSSARPVRSEGRIGMSNPKPRTYKPGAQKRKERKEREDKELELVKSLRTVDSFFNKKLSKANETNAGTTSPTQTLHDIPVVEAENADISIQADYEDETSQDSQPPLTEGENLSNDPAQWPEKLSQEQIDILVKMGPPNHPAEFPRNADGYGSPNGETMQRDWLVWSRDIQALFCFPCRLFSKLPNSQRSQMALSGIGREKKWNKLHDKIQAHGKIPDHKVNYIRWRDAEFNVTHQTGIDKKTAEQIQNEANRWKAILERILHVTLFLCERNLAFCGSSLKVGDTDSGNFLGMLELLGHYDSVIGVHLDKVQESQQTGKRMPAHYLSPESQNEFIEVCAKFVTNTILQEIVCSKYYSLIIDGTPDISHEEQIAFVLRYVHFEEGTSTWEIKERFLKFVNFEKKKGIEIALLVEQTLKEANLELGDCRAQTYDNGSNMSGKYESCRSHILLKNPLALFSSCAAHNLNLVGVNSVETSSVVKTFFGNVQKLYNLFSCSPQRWRILKETAGVSVHRLSETRWSARKDAISPLAKRLPDILKSLEGIKELNITAESHTEVLALEKYFSSFTCILLITVWHKVLSCINHLSVILQGSTVTLDEEVSHINELGTEIQTLRDSWSQLLDEAKAVSQNWGFQTEFPEKRGCKRKRFFDEMPLSSQQETTGTLIQDHVRKSSVELAEDNFRTTVFLPALDTIIAQLATRYKACTEIVNMFCVLWKYPQLNDEELKNYAHSLGQMYTTDLNEEELLDELNHLKTIHKVTIGQTLSPIKLINKLYQKQLHSLFPQICIAIRLFCTFPATSAEAERSFSKLSKIKNHKRSAMGQERLSSMAVLSIESDVARKLDFGEVITSFAGKKARKVYIM